jgi:hypothetical protein
VKVPLGNWFVPPGSNRSASGDNKAAGAAISPLLNNLYTRRFVLGWKTLRHEKRLQAFIVNYADDLAICCRSQAEEALAKVRDMMSKLKLTVSETKTRVCRLPEEKFELLWGRRLVGAIRRRRGGPIWGPYRTRNGRNASVRGLAS